MLGIEKQIDTRRGNEPVQGKIVMNAASRMRKQLQRGDTDDDFDDK